MRRGLGRITGSVIGRPSNAAATSVAAAFSTSSSGGGRGRGLASVFPFTIEGPSKSENSDPKTDKEAPPQPPHGRGRGRGQPLPSSPLLPSFSAILGGDLPIGRGGGRLPTEAPRKDSGSPSPSPPKRLDKDLPGEVLSVLSGAGRGKVGTPATDQPGKPKPVNRHIKQQERQQQPIPLATSPQEQLSQEDKVLKAVEILSKGDQKPGAGRAVAGAERGRGGGRMGRGRGRGPGGRTGDRVRSGRDSRFVKTDEEHGEDPFFGDPEDEQKVAEKLGPEVMSKVKEGLEEMSGRVLPSAFDDALIEAYETNLAIECEPEWLMGDLHTNPDIDEMPPISLRDALEKMKPFLLQFWNVDNEEEWEKLMEAAIEEIHPIMEEIMDCYCGPDRITAKQQQAELESISNTLPASAPSSVKRFTETALLTLQSNPGWKFNQKCQFMDKIVREVSQQYK